MNNTAFAGSVEMIDPNELLLETNIRTEAPLDKGFVDSIRQEGVITPVMAYRDEHGIHVRAGQRRTLGAREAGVATIRVHIIDATDSTEADRLIHQLIENDQRADITEIQRVAAYKALELEGLSVGAIAKRTGAKQANIKTSLTVAASEIGTRFMANAGLTLDQSATLLEFADDPDVVDRLISVATVRPASFPHEVERERQELARAAAVDAATTVEVEKGHRILDTNPSYGQSPWGIEYLLTADGKRVDTASIQGKAGVAARIIKHYHDSETRVLYYVDDPDALGLTLVSYAISGGGTTGPMTDDQKAARKTLIANNKAWDAAEVVRREWLTTFLSRKTLPKDAPLQIAKLLTIARNEIAESMGHSNRLAAHLLGLEGGNSSSENRLATYLASHPTKAGHVALAIALGGVEDTTDRGTWRYPKATIATYLTVIAAWGYPLSPVEKIAAMIDDESATA